MPSIRRILRFFYDRPVLADFSAALGMAAYALSLWFAANRQISVLDEGLYLFKGWLYVTGRYSPFEAYGPWTNQMPLAFLIPGWVEWLFGPGLRTGRMMAVALGLLMLVGLWLTSRRLGGRWIAAGIVMVIALNPAAARMYAMAASQSLVACILAWTLWFSLGADRRQYQLLIGGLLAGSIVMVRINMLPILPLLTLYLLWARGWKMMLWSLTGMLCTFGGIHLLYWPDILELWAKWLPFGFLKPWFPPKVISTWNPDNPIEFRVASFFLAFRYHFAALGGSLAAWIFWPQKEKMNTERFKIAIFLSALLVILIVLHAWAALGNDYCVFCFPTYTAFYCGVGLLLAALTLPASGLTNISPGVGWNLDPAGWRKWLGSILFLSLLAGMAYSAESAAEGMFGGLFYKRLLNTQVPGLQDALIWQVLANKFQLEYGNLFNLVHAWLPVLIAVLFTLLVLAVAFVAARRSKSPVWGLGIVSILALGSFLSPLPVLAGDYNSYDCSADVISGYESAGQLLAKSIPQGAKIFWAGYSPVTLLYLPGVQIFPAQLHGAYSLKISADNDALEKHGWWNESLAEKWLSEADFILAEQKNLGKNDWLGADNRLENFELVTQSAPRACTPVQIQTLGEDTGAMFLYRRK